MKVLIISKNEICYNARLLKTADFLAARGVDVTVFNPVVGIAPQKVYEESVRDKGWTVVENDISKRRFKSYISWIVVSMIHQAYTTLWRKFKFAKAMPYYLNKGLVNNKINSKEKYDFIIINLIDNLPFSVRIKQSTGAKIIYDSQEYFVGQYQKYEQSLLEWVRDAESKFIHEADIVIATTNAMLEQLVLDYKLKMPVFRVRNVPSTAMLLKQSNSNERYHDPVYLVWHGMGIFFNNTRGVHILVQAIAKCKSNVKLVLQGSINHNESQTLNELLTNYNIKGKVVVMDPAPPYGIVASLEKYSIGLIGELPEEDNQRLTSSNKLFDYLCAGLAVIAPDLPGLNETVQDLGVGLTYPPGDVDELAAAIDLLVSNHSMMLAFQERARSISSEQLNWENDFEPVWKLMSNG